MIRLSAFSVLVCIALFALASTATQAEIDGHQVLEGLNVSPSEIEKLESGGMLTFSDEAYENTQRDLAADALISIQ